MGKSITQAQIMTAVRYFLFLVGTWLANHKYIPAESVNDFVAYALIILPPAWAFIDNYLKERQTKARETAAVRAGVAHAEDITSPTIPPAAVSPKEAQVIIATYAPVTK